jgi:acyl carrier protein
MEHDNKVHIAITKLFDNVGLTPKGFKDEDLLFPDGVASMGEIDSLMAIQVAVELEEILGVDLVPGGFQGLKTIGELRLEIQRQLDGD